MKQVSLCMIVRDEEEMLAQCLNSVKNLCDEIIIVDTGSVDQTKKIAAAYTDKIYDFIWIDDFSAARNFSFKQATKDFILWLDADDILLDTEQKKFINLKETLNDEVDAVSMLYHIAFDEYGNPTFSYRRNRLVKRKNHFNWIGPVHEYLNVSGNITFSDIVVTHQKGKKNTTDSISNRNIMIYERRLKKGEIFTPRDLYYYANELKDHQRYTKAILYYNKFLETKRGWIEDIIRAHIYLGDCYRVLDMQEKEFEILLSSLSYDVPRPEVACRLGDIFKLKKQYNTAIFWYETAIQTDNTNDSGFANHAFSTWYPHLQLCVCYWKVNEVKKAQQHNLQAKKYRPKDPVILNNELFFDGVKH